MLPRASSSPPTHSAFSCSGKDVADLQVKDKQGKHNLTPRTNNVDWSVVVRVKCMLETDVFHGSLDYIEDDTTVQTVETVILRCGKLQLATKQADL